MLWCGHSVTAPQLSGDSSGPHNFKKNSMIRRLVLAACLAAFGLGLGCGKTDDSANNPNNLPYSKEGPPKRDGVPNKKR